MNQLLRMAMIYLDLTVLSFSKLCHISVLLLFAAIASWFHDTSFARFPQARFYGVY